MNDEESFKWAFEKSYDEELLWFECIDDINDIDEANSSDLDVE